MTFNEFSLLNDQIESILQTYIGKNDREDLSARIHVKLSPVYMNILFEQNEDFRLDVSKESSCYYIDVIYRKKSARMTETMECEHCLKFLDGIFTEVTKAQSKQKSLQYCNNSPEQYKGK